MKFEVKLYANILDFESLLEFCIKNNNACTGSQDMEMKEKICPISSKVTQIKIDVPVSPFELHLSISLNINLLKKSVTPIQAISSVDFVM